ncbi:MAG: GH92 family glycosyl hydrolase [Bacteroidales bacterium]|jgi:predicted alpha-1,2-mannosidase|nr:GH92 family glycosyl hydrolase [Bacteroidales bacterium]
MVKINCFILCLLTVMGCNSCRQRLTDYVNPFLGTATLWEVEDLGFTPTHRTWGAEVFPGASLPNAMVQLSPVTLFHSGSGYQYEDSVIWGFTHTNKGHWNLCHVPLLPATGTIAADNYVSPFSHSNESAHPGYYQVFLERYGVNVELTSTLRCAYHRYTFANGHNIKVLADLNLANERVSGYAIAQEGEYSFSGFQHAGEKIYFYAEANRKINHIEKAPKKDGKELPVLNFVDDEGSKILELKIGFSFVSIENAKHNLAQEMTGKSFAEVRKEAVGTWESLLSKITVSGGTEAQMRTFYSCLYRSFLWPALRSDVNGEFTNARRQVSNTGFRYYTDPSFWDDYRNKLILLGLLSPDVAVDVISSVTDRGKKRGYMPNFFHGDHASVFITGSYLRGLRGWDIDSAYLLMLHNAKVESPSRPHLAKYIEKGYVPEWDLEAPRLETVATAGVTKTLEFAYDDYAVALMARELGDKANYDTLMSRSLNYKNVFDPATKFMRGRLDNGEWITPFDPQTVYYEYMYREANGWQSSFFAPHNVDGLIALFPDKEYFEKKLDSLFTIPWRDCEADNMSVFIGQYCHGNQPDHGYPHLYYFVGKQEKAQDILNHIMANFYNMGKDGLAYAGMDDAGEMSAWYVFHAIGLYTLSPADPEYIVTVPLFDKVTLWTGNDKYFTISRKNSGNKITGITCNGKKLDGYFLAHDELSKETLVIETE